MDDVSGNGKDNGPALRANMETSYGRSMLGKTELVLHLEQRILELQGELEQVWNLVNLSLTLNVPDVSHQNNKINTKNPPTPQNPLPPQNLPPEAPHYPSLSNITKTLRLQSHNSRTLHHYKSHNIIPARCRLIHNTHKTPPTCLSKLLHKPSPTSTIRLKHPSMIICTSKFLEPTKPTPYM